MNIDQTAWISPDAHVSGDVTLGPGCSVWPCAVIRGDDSPVVIGARTNIQDGTVVHESEENAVTIGSDVSIGHNAIIHGCTIDDGALIGMGAIILNRAHVGQGALVAAGTLVPEGMEIPAGMVAMGNPARVKRPLRESERAHLLSTAADYASKALNHRT